MPTETRFNFEISLSVLNHLGRNLYRSFATVLGEAISNAWDAEATNVWIFVDPNKQWLVIKDDGIGMTARDFQNKFLKIGYSKRSAGARSPTKKRPYIGRKGIGKLALLSCAERITVISRVQDGQYIGGTIDNSKLDKAISKDLTPQKYPLAKYRVNQLAEYVRDHEHGTIIRFDKLKDGVHRSIDFLTRIIALYFRFSLIDKSFAIFVNSEPISHEHLKGLIDRTQFLWKIGKSRDPLVSALESLFATQGRHEIKSVSMRGVRGFVASVEQPKHLKILTTDERVGVDLFVNGRLRERDILKHIPTARIVESYLYGQIHFDDLDDAQDRFTSSREGIVADDPKFQAFLNRFKKVVTQIAEDWDRWRIKYREEGDPENPRITKRKRAALGLYGAVADAFVPPKKGAATDEVEQWVDSLSNDAAYNFESYAECFISENLVRNYIRKKNTPLSPEAIAEVEKYKRIEEESKQRANISIVVRRKSEDLSYLSMDNLANLVDKPKDPLKEAGLGRDAREFKPMRDAVAHTALLTDPAKARLSAVRENIKARVKTLLSKP